MPGYPSQRFVLNSPIRLRYVWINCEGPVLILFRTIFISSFFISINISQEFPFQPPKLSVLKNCISCFLNSLFYPWTSAVFREMCYDSCESSRLGVDMTTRKCCCVWRSATHHGLCASWVADTLGCFLHQEFLATSSRLFVESHEIVFWMRCEGVDFIFIFMHKGSLS